MRSVINKRKLVLIEWEDSVQPISSWLHLSDFKDHEAIKCVSVGWLVFENRNVKAIAPNLGDYETEHVQASGIMRIPTRCITKVREIK